MKVQRCMGSLTAVAVAAVWSMAGAAEAPPQHDASTQRELLDQYCVTCHNFSDTAGGLDLFFAVRLDESITQQVLGERRSRLGCPSLDLAMQVAGTLRIWIILDAPRVAIIRSLRTWRTASRSV